MLGPGLDSRPYRLAWPPGTALFELAGAEAHAVAAAALKAAGARVPRACLLRRVAADVRAGHGLAAAAQAAGLRGDRLSAWALQGLPAMGQDVDELAALLAAVGDTAARGSTVAGELAAPSRAAAEDLLAGAGLLGRVMSLPEAAEELDWSEANQHPADAQRWLFTAQQQRLSEAQMSTYSAHVLAAEETDEDFFGHFS
ncbi:hypothetical protein WJX81_001167 [Elliptochloris bilobata]|uniref:Uncharacterized protein n=1 Tax=Elliptochloris bilobata TaxID=381761 RepID=A0AAW1SFK5_9CHLO